MRHPRSWYCPSRATIEHRLLVTFARVCPLRRFNENTAETVHDTVCSSFDAWWFLSQLFMAWTIETSVPPQRLRSQCGQAVLLRLQQWPCKDIPEIGVAELLEKQSSTAVRRHVFRLYMDLRWLADNKVRLRRHA